MQGKRHIFGPLLLEYKIEKDLLTKLIDIGKQMKRSANENLASNMESQFHYEPENAKWIQEQLQPMFDDYRKQYCDILFEQTESNREFLYRKEEMHFWKLKHQSLWINFMKSGEYNPPHFHNNCEISYVIFADVPEEIFKENEEYVGSADGPGTIEFLFGTNYPEDFCSRKTFLPKSGTMFIFPSGFMHTVMPFKSDVTRITIAGNLYFDMVDLNLLRKDDK